MRAGRVGILALTLSLGAGCGDPEAAYVAAPEGTLTFNEHVAPIVYEHCTPCHRPGEVTPFSFVEFEQVRKRARQIAEVTGSRYMPPWQPEPGEHAFVGERRLSVQEIGTLEQWFAEGAPEGDPALRPTPPRFPEGWSLGEPDLVVRMPRPFEVGAEGEDLFWNFVIPVPLETRRFVRGVEFRPGNRQVVHHAEIRVDTTGVSRELEAEPGGGFSGTVEGGGAAPPLGHFLGWVPGSTPFLAEKGGTWPLSPGDDLVLEVHLVPTGKPEQLEASIGLFFSDEAPSFQPYLLRLGSRNLDIPADDSDYVMTDAYRLPAPVTLRSIQPHAHYLGKELRASARLPDGTQLPLIHIADWDFTWQDAYRYAEPIALPAGTELSMHYRYDNSEDNPRNPNQPPRRVLYGPQSKDEMGDLWLQVVPDRPEDLPLLRRERIARDLSADRERYEMMLDIDSEAAATHYGLGNVAYRQNDLATAERHYERAIELEPQHVSAHNDLGTLRVRQGRPAEAEALYRKALALDARHRRALKNLAGLLIGSQRYDEAAALLERALALDALDARSHANLAGIRFLQGDLAAAETGYETALRLRPGFQSARENLAKVRLAAKSP